MSDPQQEHSKGERSAKTKRFRVWLSLAILFFCSAGNILVLLVVVPKFEDIFKDALAGSGPLPPLTRFIIAARMALAVVDLGWPILGTVLVRLQKNYAILWINVGQLWAFLQLGITIYALIRPMIDFHGGMSDAPVR